MVLCMCVCVSPGSCVLLGHSPEGERDGVSEKKESWGEKQDKTVGEIVRERPREQ